MTLTLATVLALAHQCAPGIAAEALVPQLRVESQCNELAIGINHGPSVQASTIEEATAIATRYIRAGYSVDLGIAQINSHNLARLNMTVVQAFDACTSLRAAETVLSENYAVASQSYSGLEAISRTWSYYNSGSAERGMVNGYVRKVWAAANELLPLIRAGSEDGSPNTQIALQDQLGAREASASRSSVPQQQKQSFVYGTTDAGVVVFK